MNHNISIYIGIDVSKDKHDICIKNNDGNVLKQFQIQNNKTDLNKFYATVDKIKSDRGDDWYKFDANNGEDVYIDVQKTSKGSKNIG